MSDTSSKKHLKDGNLLTDFEIFIRPTIFSILATTPIIIYVENNHLALFWDYYRQFFRSGFFTSFLALGSFVWAVKSFTILNLKKDFYEKQPEDPEFISQITTAQKFSNSKIDCNLYFNSLKNLSKLMFASITSSLITSTIQITIGLIHHNFSAYIACASVAFSLYLVFWTLRQVNKNFNDWLDRSADKFVDDITNKIGERK